MFWKKPSIKDLLPPPVQTAHGEYSMIFSAHDDGSRATSSLISLSVRAIAEAAEVNLQGIYEGRPHIPTYAEVWPGEHYKLLAGWVKVLQPRCIIEIGTATGLSALCMHQFMPEGGKLITFDVVPWHQYSNTVLHRDDFTEGSLVQHVEDLSDLQVVEKHAAMLAEADLIFVDATHDGCLEKKLLENLQNLPFGKTVYWIFDDIRVWTMLKMWREVQLPKLDLTSFGHWSGTGIVELRW
ncbi:MAG: methyltransferase [Chlamydiia bacterium]|nr:methyltransferase [Chlamydiia bacterium]